MILHAPRKRPDPWSTKRLTIQRSWIVPFVAFEYPFEWFAYFLSHWSFLETLEYLGSFSMLIAVIFYFSESGDRLKQKHYQAWQVINTAQGKGGSGGRIEALQELEKDGVPLVGVDISGAFVQGLRLPGAALTRANLNAIDARNSDFQNADLSGANLHAANLRDSNLSNARLQDTDMRDADFCLANLSGADLSDAAIDNADLGSANLANLKWQKIKSIKGASLQHARNAPEGFLQWAREHGAITSGESSCSQ
jgi:hypothetical protein